MKKIRVAIVGYGSVGQAAMQAVLSSSDMELAGIVRRNVQHIPHELKNCNVVGNIDTLSDVDVALLCVPTREVPCQAAALLAKGISTVDSYDIHTGICDLRNELMSIACEHGAVSIVSAGWDPGSDSVVRCLMNALTPSGITYTDFGPGRSMGHTVAVRAIEGVEDALSLTIPLGTGLHRRMVYVQLKQGYDFEAVREQILQDDYFRHDETHVQQVGSVAELNNVAHSVNIVRNGVSGTTSNQQLAFRMSINNPALTGQVMVSCARAAVRLHPGAYTMIEIPPVYLLPGDVEQNIRALV